MKWFRKQEPAAAAGQLRSGERHPFGMLRDFAPVRSGETRLYRAVKESVPVVDAAHNMIAGYVANVDATAVRRYCTNAMVNYILSDYAARCADAQVRFLHTVRLDELRVDEIMFSSILSNALDNALNAQRSLPEKERRIEVMLRTQNDRILLSVRNPFGRKPPFVDGMPVTERAGHGYGTRSICYMTERLGGECQFTTEGNTFILRAII